VVSPASTLLAAVLDALLMLNALLHLKSTLLHALLKISSLNAPYLQPLWQLLAPHVVTTNLHLL
jgi:hypothetical protein